MLVVVVVVVRKFKAPEELHVCNYLSNFRFRKDTQRIIICLKSKRYRKHDMCQL